MTIDFFVCVPRSLDCYVFSCFITIYWFRYGPTAGGNSWYARPGFGNVVDRVCPLDYRLLRILPIVVVITDVVLQLAKRATFSI